MTIDPGGAAANMCMRDVVAARVLQGMYASTPPDLHPSSDYEMIKIAKWAFAQADAFIAVSAKGGNV